MLYCFSISVRGYQENRMGLATLIGLTFLDDPRDLFANVGIGTQDVAGTAKLPLLPIRFFIDLNLFFRVFFVGSLSILAFEVTPTADWKRGRGGISARPEWSRWSVNVVFRTL